MHDSDWLEYSGTQKRKWIKISHKDIGSFPPYNDEGLPLGERRPAPSCTTSLDCFHLSFIAVPVLEKQENNKLALPVH